MIDRIKALFGNQDGVGGPPGGHRRADQLQLAAAALMVEAARLDGDFDAAERSKIHELLVDRFALTPEEAKTLLETAVEAQEAGHQLLPYTRVIKERFDQRERIELVEMLWEVAYADDELHDYEANLLRRIGGLIYVSDRERGAAKQRVLSRRAGQREGVGKPRQAARISGVKE